MTDKIKNQIIFLVAEYIVARKEGAIFLAKELRDSIYKVCKKHNLDSNLFFFHFGDPDDLKKKREVHEKVEKWRNLQTNSFLFTKRFESFDEDNGKPICSNCKKVVPNNSYDQKVFAEHKLCNSCIDSETSLGGNYGNT